MKKARIIYDDDRICSSCQGTGEGVFSGRCMFCNNGIVKYVPDPEDDPRPDWEREEGR